MDARADDIPQYACNLHRIARRLYSRRKRRRERGLATTLCGPAIDASSRSRSDRRLRDRQCLCGEARISLRVIGPRMNDIDQRG